MNDTPNFCRALGKVVREHREKRKWPRKRLAEAVGVSVSHIRVIETRLGNPSISIFVLIAEAFGLEPDILMHEVRQRQAFLNHKDRVEE